MEECNGSARVYHGCRVTFLGHRPGMMLKYHQNSREEEVLCAHLSCLINE